MGMETEGRGERGGERERGVIERQADLCTFIFSSMTYTKLMHVSEKEHKGERVG